jgi:membrane fusion protein (multidrug efflux system)
MRKIDRRIVVIAAFIFIVGLAYGLMRFLAAQKEDLKQRPPVEAKRYVKAEPVKYTTIISPVSAPGRLSSVAEVDIVAEASGRLQQGEVPLKKGTRFSKGDILFVVYPDEAALALKASKSQFLNTLANLLPDIRIDFPEYEQGYMEFFSSISLDQPLPPFPEVEDEKLKIFLTSRNVLSQYYTIRKDELQLSRHTTIAPFEGTFTQVLLEVGSYTNTGGRIAEAIRTDELELEVPVDRFDAAWIKIGDPVTVHSDKRGLTWKGRVIRKSQFVDPNTQSQAIFIKIQNHRNPTLLAGEYLNAEFPGHPIENAMEVPRNVVFNTNEVFVIVDGRLEKRIANIIKINEKTLIFNGLEKGEVLVMQPMINVLEGTLVERLGDEREEPRIGQNQESRQGGEKLDQPGESDKHVKPVSNPGEGQGQGKHLEQDEAGSEKTAENGGKSRENNGRTDQAQ